MQGFGQLKFVGHSSSFHFPRALLRRGFFRFKRRIMVQVTGRINVFVGYCAEALVADGSRPPLVMGSSCQAQWLSVGPDALVDSTLV